LARGTEVRAAVAFVTRSGVAELAQLFSEAEDVRLELTARASDVTEPEALLELRDEVGADVLVVIGRHAKAFHPKLWLIEHDDQLVVLSGSGNLTVAGLTTNDEQFEVLRLGRDSDEAAAQIDRFEHLTRNALPLDQIEGSTIWHEWLGVRRQQAQLRGQLAHAERLLNERQPIPERSADKAQLVEDLQQLYEDTVVPLTYPARMASGTTQLACSWLSTALAMVIATPSRSSRTRSVAGLAGGTSFFAPALSS